MGEKLMKYYKYIKDEIGFSGKIKLASETKLPSTQAAVEPDSLENIELMRDACKKLTGKEAPQY